MREKMKIIAVIILLMSCVVATAQETEKLKFSFSHRTRLTSFDNSVTLSEDTDSMTFSRHRTSLGLDWSAADNIIFRVKLTNEFRHYISPKSRESGLDEIFFDQLFIKWKNFGNIPLDITLGRQVIIFDEGFLCLDPQPLTGSRSNYFNALRGDYRIKKGHVITAFVSYIPKEDNWLPVINEGENPQALEEQANLGLGLYYRGSIGKSKLSAYYFRKDTKKNDVHPVESGISTVGARISLPVQKNLSLTAEAAIQNGSAGDNDRSAFGGYFHLDYKVRNIPLLRTLTFGGIYLSGDDPKTVKYEGWDPLWSRWPKWSESYIYTLIIENRGKVAYWSNMSALYGSVKLKFSEKFSCKASYYFLYAPEDNLSDFCGGTGNHRGDLLTVRADYRIDKNWTGHLVWENFKPGSFYSDTADGYNWFRFELMVKL